MLEGTMRMQVAGKPATVVHTGETFTETPGDVHAVSENVSETTPARFLAYFACDAVAPVTP
jgi:quercetin dioxygenase-like cupin family protein